ncbi:MAG: hypothetical protein WC470_00690 [Candidatus Paceibacterota bacterium]
MAHSKFELRDGIALELTDGIEIIGVNAGVKVYKDDKLIGEVEATVGSEKGADYKNYPCVVLKMKE